MITKEELNGQWNEVKGRLQENWGQLTEDDLSRVKGSTDQLVGVVQQKTGASRREVEEFLTSMFSDSERVKERVAETAQQYADVASEYAAEASEYLKQNYRQAADLGGAYTDKVANTVRSRPAESLAIAFGLGIAAGAVFFLKRRR